VHLSHVNLNKNDIRDISVIASMPYLLTLTANTNALKSLSFMSENPDALKYLQVSSNV
jgi:Leucine-rich repeat (LRR) protein